MTDNLAAIVRAHSLDVKLVEALVQVESSGNRFAWNPEPQYRWLWDLKKNAPFRKMTDEELLSERPPADFPALAGDPDQEFWAQQASWGLMQIMGAVARELGFRGPYLTMLTDEELALEYGCKHLANQLAWARGNVVQALAAYNGGRSGNLVEPYRNASYARKVIERMMNA